MKRAALLVLAVAHSGALRAQSAEDFFRQPMISSAAISPDGRRVAYVTREADSTIDRWRHRIRLMPATGGASQLFAEGTAAAWAPKGDALAFISADGRQLSVQDTAGGAARVLTAVPMGVDGFRWSRDGSMIAFVADPSQVATEMRSIRGADRGARTALHVVSVAGGEVRRLTDPGRLAIGPAAPGSVDLLEFDWLDIGSLVVSGRAAGAGESSDAASLFRVDVATGESRYIAGIGGRWHVPVVSPDGQWIAFTGHPLTRLGYVPEELIILRPNGSGLKRLTVGLDRDVSDHRWSSDNRSIWFATEDRGSRNIHRVNVRNARIDTGTNGTHLMVLADMSRVGEFGMALRSTPTTTSGLVRFPLNQPAQFTWLIEHPAIAGIGEVEEFEVRGRHGAPIHAWLLRPPRFDAGRRWPLLVDIHGGPHAMAAAGYAPTAIGAAAAGWLVLRVNPRGSTGFGSDYANGLGREWPGADVEDIATVIADVVQRGLADSTRMAVIGTGSGGVTAASLLERISMIRAGILMCTGDAWLRGGSGPDRAPWREWFRASPFQLMPESWLAGSLLVRGVETSRPVLVIEGTHLVPGPVDFSAAYFSALVRRDIPAEFLQLRTSCSDMGPTTQATVAEHARAWLDGLP